MNYNEFNNFFKEILKDPVKNHHQRHRPLRNNHTVKILLLIASYIYLYVSLFVKQVKNLEVYMLQTKAEPVR